MEGKAEHNKSGFSQRQPVGSLPKVPTGHYFGEVPVAERLPVGLGLRNLVLPVQRVLPVLRSLKGGSSPSGLPQCNVHKPECQVGNIPETPPTYIQVILYTPGAECSYMIPHKCEAGAMNIPIFQMKILRHRKVK